MSQQTFISACPLDCFGVCSFKVIRENGQIISLEPNEENPVTGKLICNKGRSHVARMNHPDRILEPMQKTADGWIPVSWDTALDFITEKVTDCLKTDGHHSIASYMGGGAAGKLKGAMELFFHHLGGGTVFTGSLCWAAGIEAQTRDFGKVVTHSPEDLLNAHTLIFWGKNPADTHFHLMSWVTKARKNGCRVILIDPISSTTASFADTVIRPLPGTDWALALAVIQHILFSEQDDSEATQNIRFQQPGLLEFINHLDRQLLLTHCGVTQEDVSLLAQAYGVKKPCATYIGYGMQRYESGGSAIRLIDLLAVLTGQVGVAGGGVNYANKVNSGLFDFSWAEPSFPVNERLFQQGNLGPHLLGASDPAVKLLFIACGNPALQAPDAIRVAQALKAVETVVVIDHFMTDTAALADLVLPATFFLEEEDLISSSMWNTTIHYAPQIVQPRGQARSELHIFSDLAKRLKLFEFPQLTAAQWLERLVRPLNDTGITLEKLKEKGWITSPNRQEVPWQDQRFLTEDGLYHPLPLDAAASLVTALHTPPDDTLPLISFHRRHSINSQHTWELDETLPEAMFHPDTAAHYDITAGDGLMLSNAFGSLEATAFLDPNIRPGIIAMKQGAWKYRGQCINNLSPSGVSDMGEQAILNAGRVRITKR